ncbi:hypothetical protein ACJX0J_040834, partial [Zea mays]
IGVGYYFFNKIQKYMFYRLTMYERGIHVFFLFFITIQANGRGRTTIKTKKLVITLH